MAVAISEQYVLDLALSGVVVNPTWLLITTWMVPPTV